MCYVHTDPLCTAGGVRETDGTYDPDDGNQHGTACMGMAAATGIDASGAQTDFYGSAPDADLVDVRIGTDLGAGPFENYLIEQEFYESAMNGLQWIIDNKDTAWQGADEANYGIDIISLSWGITSHEGGGSDGEDMHSRILNEAMEPASLSVPQPATTGPTTTVFRAWALPVFPSPWVRPTTRTPSTEATTPLRAILHVENAGTTVTETAQ